MPANSFGYVPTPAIVAPIEFTMSLEDYSALGGHVDHVRALADVLRDEGKLREPFDPTLPWPLHWTARLP